MTKIRKIVKQLLFQGGTERLIKEIESFIRPADKILDLGAGSCLNTKILRDKGYNVLPIDIKNRSKYIATPSRVYNGTVLPFRDNEFDVCLLISVLHHTPDPQVMLKEAKRVSKKLVVYEDTVTNIFQRFYTYLIDCYCNWELVEAHTNKTDTQWRQLFRKLHLTLVGSTYRRTWLFLHNPMYILKKA